MAHKALLLACFIAAGAVMEAQGMAVDCQSYNPSICKLDAIPYCLVNGTVVSGSCSAERAQCVDRVNVDDTFAACSQTKTNFHCSNFNPMICTKDAIPYCLNNGTVVRGTCFAQKAVCQEGRQVDDTYKACNQAGMNNNNLRNTGDDGNSAFRFSATGFLVLIPLAVVALFH